MVYPSVLVNHFGKSDTAHALSRLAAATMGRARKIVEACQVDQSASEAAVIFDNLHRNDDILGVKFVSELFFHFSVVSRLLKAVSW